MWVVLKCPGDSVYCSCLHRGTLSPEKAIKVHPTLASSKHSVRNLMNFGGNLTYESLRSRSLRFLPLSDSHLLSYELDRYYSHALNLQC